MKTILGVKFGVIMGLVMMISSVQAEGLMVKDAWVRAAPPNAPALAAFMKLENHADGEISVVEATTTLPVARVELHRTIMADGMMKMVQQQTMPVKAHSGLELKPGSWHIMLIKPQKVPVAGDTVHLTLHLSDGSKQMVMAPVRKGGMMMKGGHQMGNHNH